MKIFIFCVILTSSAIVFYLALLRIRRPRNSVAALLIVFTGVLCGGLISAHLLNKGYSVFPAGFWEFLHVIIFYVPVMLSCIITFVALEDDSPSMTIVRFIEQAGAKGRNRNQIRQIINDEALILPRINAMVKNGWIEARENEYQAMAKGRFYNKLLALAPKLLNISREG
ncbi:MAG: hypothetical protein A2X34_10695 [Elusimicrobia bacterium GWC2_51_8]|nr:MAG: hypothetical protein A2X33_09390 [Elusimicrobia bacterium GWA2_51_34]OGR62228.1 MAG: hypothetical protein A2X34_10695 [Elusimicrobia bacterium GWC2_51_8]OGR88363.1 MAG: hypothetical protein A2021_01950 [Elusimicrobia bacterium GWF2_52_66]HAF94607.1 hypothetical protein [Elusimicrobiota bacterium]HCE98059.1 hypothetical protein [Elusimicrobiota bacterium]